MKPLPLRFTETDLDAANVAWGCNCGPGALAAVLGKTLDDVRTHLGAFDEKRYMNPRMMDAALASIGAEWAIVKGPVFPDYGLARIQWEGPWTQPGVPFMARYRYSHWVGACRKGPDDIGIFDINAMNSGGWVSLDDWSNVIVPHILKICVPRATGGWHVTNSLQIIKARTAP